MRLPDMTIPDIPLPIEIAAHIHPSVVHFAIVIPVIILLLEVYNVAAKRPSISLFSFFLVLVLIFVLASSYLTGEVDGKNAMQLFSNEAKAELKEHTQIGIFLLYSSLGLLLFKILFMTLRKTWGRMLFILIVSLFVLGILYQAKQGGILVYKHGANVETVRSLKSSSSEITADNKKMIENLKALNHENSLLKQKNQEFSRTISELEKLKNQAEERAKMAQNEANATLIKAHNEAETLLKNSKKEAEELLHKSKKEADKILNNAHKAAQIVMKNTKESASALERAKKLIEGATAKVLVSQESNESNHSH